MNDQQRGDGGVHLKKRDSIRRRRETPPFNPDPATRFVPLRGKLVWTYGLMWACLFLLIGSCIVGGGLVPLSKNPMWGPSVEALITVGALRTTLVRDGEWWRILWAPFLHAGWFHIAMNFLLWYKLGIMVEPDWGFWRTAGIFMISAISGNLMSATLDPYNVSVGASGGIFGVMGGCVPYVVEYWHTIPEPKCIMYIVIISLIVGLACGFLPYVDNYAHIGGAIGGVLTGFMTISKFEIAVDRESFLRSNTASAELAKLASRRSHDSKLLRQRSEGSPVGDGAPRTRRHHLTEPVKRRDRSEAEEVSLRERGFVDVSGLERRRKREFKLDNTMEPVANEFRDAPIVSAQLQRVVMQMGPDSGSPKWAQNDSYFGGGACPQPDLEITGKALPVRVRKVSSPLRACPLGAASGSLEDSRASSYLPSTAGFLSEGVQESSASPLTSRNFPQDCFSANSLQATTPTGEALTQGCLGASHSARVVIRRRRRRAFTPYAAVFVAARGPNRTEASDNDDWILQDDASSCSLQSEALPLSTPGSFFSPRKSQKLLMQRPSTSTPHKSGRHVFFQEPLLCASPSEDEKPSAADDDVLNTKRRLGLQRKAKSEYYVTEKLHDSPREHDPVPLVGTTNEVADLPPVPPTGIEEVGIQRGRGSSQNYERDFRISRTLKPTGPPLAEQFARRGLRDQTQDTQTAPRKDESDLPSKRACSPTCACWNWSFYTKIRETITGWNYRPRERVPDRMRLPKRQGFRSTPITDIDDSCICFGKQLWAVRVGSFLLLMVFWAPLLYFLFGCAECYNPPGQLVRALKATAAGCGNQLSTEPTASDIRAENLHVASRGAAFQSPASAGNSFWLANHIDIKMRTPRRLGNVRDWEWQGRGRVRPPDLRISFSGPEALKEQGRVAHELVTKTRAEQVSMKLPIPPPPYSDWGT